MTKKDITYQDKLNELRMDIKHPNNDGVVFVLVEGETDIRLYRKLFDENTTKVECVPGGNPTVEKAVEDLSVIYRLLIGIRDADFIKANGLEYKRKNMFLTDWHDLEIGMIAEDEVFKAVVMEFLNITNVQCNEVRALILKVIQKISCLKWLNELHNLELAFEGVGFQDLLTFPASDKVFSDYLERVLKKSPNAKTTDKGWIESEVEKLTETNVSAYQYTNGHDFMKALVQYIRTNGNANKMNDSSLASTFRIKYSTQEFQKTELYHQTSNWATLSGCKIF